MKIVRPVRVPRPDARHVDHAFAGFLDRRHGLRMGKTSRDGNQHIAQPPTMTFPDGDHVIENMNDSLRLSWAGQFSGPSYVSGKLLDLLLNPRKADIKLSSHQRGSISPLNIVDVKIEKL